VRRYLGALQTSVVNNSSAYGYSVAITGSFGIASEILGKPSVFQVFLFGAGAVAAFTLVDVAVTGGFKKRLRSDPPEVVVLGSSMSFLSVGGALGGAALTAEIIDVGVAWALAAFAGTLAYVAIVTIELALAERVDPGEVEEQE
jgi:hypothetical protein